MSYRFRGRRGRKRRRFIPKEQIQHSPSLLGNAPAANVGLLHVLVHANGLAGGSMNADRRDEDRLTEVGNGRHIRNMIVSIGFIPSANSQGYYELGFIKYERSFTVPTLGTDPVPSTANMLSVGLQQEVRSLTPGYMVKYMQVPISAETTKIISVKVDWAKYKKSMVRDGDYFTLLVFNRTAAAGTYDINTRFNTSSN